MKRKTSSFLFIVFFSMLIGFLLGIEKEKRFNYWYPKNKSAEKITTLFNYIDNNYIDEINVDELVDEIIGKIINKLDPHSSFIPSEEIAYVSELMQGHFVGIGVSFTRVNDTIAVVRVLDNGPSQKAGIHAGDRLLMADNDTLFGKKLTNEDVRKKLKGVKGSIVDVEVYREKTKERFFLKIKRDEIQLKSIYSYLIRENIGYVKMNRFSATTHLELREAIDKLNKQGMKKLILDLQDNGGGYLFSAKAIADEFLGEDKTVVITESNKGKRKRFVATEKGSYKKRPLYVILNKNSASASEVLSGAIQDNDRGIILGSRSFGKGLVQTQYNIGESDFVRLTTNRYYTPTGRSIQRPYEEGESDVYYQNLDNREEEEYCVDSLAFTTPKGNVVYGGGGISPNIRFSKSREIQKKEYDNYYQYVNLTRDFIFWLLDKDRTKYATVKEEAFLSSSWLNENKKDLLKEFIQYVKEKELPFEEKNNEDVLQYIRENLALQLYGQRMYLRIANERNDFVIKTLDYIQKEAE